MLYLCQEAIQEVSKNETADTDKRIDSEVVLRMLEVRLHIKLFAKRRK